MSGRRLQELKFLPAHDLLQTPNKSRSDLHPPRPEPGPAGRCASYEIKMVEDERGLVHLSQDKEHLVVYKFLEFFQVTVHLFL